LRYTAAPTGRARSCSMWRWPPISEGIRFDGHTLVVRIPTRFQRRGGRKRIVTPDGTELAPSSKPQPDGTLVKALVRAWRWRRLIDERRFGTLADLADTERISRSYGCRVLCLTLLAPDVIERIPDGRPTARARAVPEAVPGRLGAAARVVHSERRLICQGKRSLEESKFGSAGGSRKPSTSRPSARARTRRGDRASMYSTSGNRRPRRILSTFTIKVRPD
jgi:hypothetical protein